MEFLIKLMAFTILAIAFMFTIIYSLIMLKDLYEYFTKEDDADTTKRTGHL